jgi:hypothetical protein
MTKTDVNRIVPPRASPKGRDVISMPHNAQISGVAKVARLLRKQKA